MSELETSEITVVEREFDDKGQVIKETITVTKPRTIPFNPNQTAPWTYPPPSTTPTPWRWPTITYNVC